MKLLYKQPEENTEASGLCRLGIHNCYLKALSLHSDRKRVTRKTHRHTGYEIHMLTHGCQVYQAGSLEYRLEAGDFLLICPNTPHTVLAFDNDSQKYSVTFQMKANHVPASYSGKLSGRILENLGFIATEAAQPKQISGILIENCILEILVSLFRMSDMQEKAQSPVQHSHAVLTLAKQYIEDNIESAPDVQDVADYCGLSTKHLTRLFTAFEESTPGAYIKAQQVKRAETLLAETALSLKQISDRLCFSSEYYFNAFFKRNAGMPPGEYRKMLGK